MSIGAATVSHPRPQNSNIFEGQPRHLHLGQYSHTTCTCRYTACICTDGCLHWSLLLPNKIACDGMYTCRHVRSCHYVRTPPLDGSRRGTFSTASAHTLRRRLPVPREPAEGEAARQTTSICTAGTPPPHRGQLPCGRPPCLWLR